jgi:MFS family permease
MIGLFLSFASSGRNPASSVADHKSSPAKFNYREMVRLDFIALLTAVAVFGFSLGISYPMLNLAMESAGISNTIIGFNSMMTAVGILITSLWLPTAARRYGAYRIMIASLIITAISFLCFGLFFDVIIWMFLRLMMGMAINGLFMMSETWVNLIANDTNRGRYIGVYATIMAASFAMGPMMVPMIGYEGMMPYLVCAGVVLTGVIPVVLSRNVMPDFSRDKPGGNVISYILKVPTIMGAIMLLAFVDFAAFSLMPVYAVRTGVEKDMATYMVAALVMGSVFLQLPLGWLSDHIDRNLALMICGIATLAGALLMPQAMGQSILVWPLLFFWGGIAYGLMTIAMAMLGSRFQGTALVAANAATAIAWGIGGLFGPSLGGFAMDLAGPHALMWVVALASAVFLIVAIYRHPEALRPRRP